ncbi:hypothetical protein PCANB_001028 [Pneumocystis canis]|nr:hypothetical protein PCK1_000994 [Pneumocystis canis]KAG5437236.1 hypothetical protein PCANB_001028 [Pneumocystis canis]
MKNKKNELEISKNNIKEHNNNDLNTNILIGFGLPIFNKPQVILEKENDKYKTIEESGILKSSIFQSRKTLLQGKDGNKEGFINKKYKISKIGEFTLRIELFSFPETIFYLVKYITETNNHFITIKSEKDSSLSSLNSNDNNNNIQMGYIDFFRKYFLDFFKDDPFKSEKVSKAIERLKIVSLNPNFKEILHLIISGQATTEQKNIFNSYIISSETSEISSNHNKEKTKSPTSYILQNEQDFKNTEYNEFTKIKQKKKHFECFDIEIVFEFKENLGEKWILPKDIITEKLGSNEPFGVLVSFIYIQDSLFPHQFQPITLEISSCSQKLWDFILKCSNKKEDVFETMSKILMGKRSEKLYFQHQLLITDTKTFKDQSEEKISLTLQNKKSTFSQKRKITNETDDILSPDTDNKSDLSVIPKKNKPRKPSILPKGWYCNICNVTETPLRRRGPDGPGTLCNACGVKWKGGKGVLPPKKKEKHNKKYNKEDLNDKDQNNVTYLS